MRRRRTGETTHDLAWRIPASSRRRCASGNGPARACGDSSPPTGLRRATCGADNTPPRRNEAACPHPPPHFPPSVEPSPTPAAERNLHSRGLVARGFLHERLSYACRHPKPFTISDLLTGGLPRYGSPSANVPRASGRRRAPVPLDSLRRSAPDRQRGRRVPHDSRPHVPEAAPEARPRRRAYEVLHARIAAPGRRATQLPQSSGCQITQWGLVEPKAERIREESPRVRIRRRNSVYSALLPIGRRPRPFHRPSIVRGCCGDQARVRRSGAPKAGRDAEADRRSRL